MVGYNEKQLQNMQDEFLKLQKLEIAIDSDRSKTSKLIDKYAGSVSTYINDKKMNKLLSEVELIIDDMVAQGARRGRAMSLKTMNNYLEKSERAIRSDRILELITRSNKKRAQQRLSIYVDEMLRDANIMKADIEIFRKQGKLSGLTTKEINKRLARAAANNASPVNTFGKRLKTLEKAVLRREANAVEMEEYRKNAKVTELWQWIAISGSPCPDCRIRAGKILSFAEWARVGTPGSGSTICRSSCMCKLIPVSIAEDLFPKVKSFKWDKESGVLTTFNDMKTLKK